VADGTVFLNGADCALAANIIAYRGDGSSELWRFVGTPFAPALSGFAIANGVVYFQTTGPDPTMATLIALDTSSGEKLTEVQLNAPAISGPAISQGKIYMGARFFFPPFCQLQAEASSRWAYRS
jgi:outer membrane protein assembly factor BamB